MIKNRALNQLKLDTLPVCESCLEGKMTKKPFTRKGLRANQPLELIYLDVCEPMNIKAQCGNTSSHLLMTIPDMGMFT